jgi:hypothetical protein
MIGNSISIDPGAGPLAFALINQDGYSSEYLSRDATSDTRIQVRHSQEKIVGDAPQVDRHNVTITQKFIPDASFPAGHFVQCSVTFRTPPGEDIATVLGWFVGLASWLADGTPANQERILNWES